MIQSGLLQPHCFAVFDGTHARDGVMRTESTQPGEARCSRPPLPRLAPSPMTSVRSLPRERRPLPVNRPNPEDRSTNGRYMVRHSTCPNRLPCLHPRRRSEWSSHPPKDRCHRWSLDGGTALARHRRTNRSEWLGSAHPPPVLCTLSPLHISLARTASDYIALPLPESKKPL